MTLRIDGSEMGTAGAATRSVKSLHPPHANACIDLGAGHFAVAMRMSNVWGLWRRLSADKESAVLVADDLSDPDACRRAMREAA